MRQPEHTLIHDAFSFSLLTLAAETELAPSRERGVGTVNIHLMVYIRSSLLLYSYMHRRLCGLDLGNVLLRLFGIRTLEDLLSRT